MKKITPFNYSSQRQYVNPLSANRTSKQLKQVEKQNTKLKNKDELPFALKIYFNTLENLVRNADTQSSKLSSQLMPQAFIKGFNQLSTQQKQHFLKQNICFLNQSYKNKQPDGSLNYTNQSLIKTIETDGYLKKYKAGLSYWSNISFKYNGQKRQIKLNYKKHVHFIDLRLYLVRKSRKQQNTLVLIRCSDLNRDQNDKIYLSFQELIFQQIYNELSNCTISFRCLKLRQLVQTNLLHNAHQLISKEALHQKALKIVDSKKIMKYLQKKKQILRELNETNAQYVNLHTQGITNISINSKRENSYKMQCNFGLNNETLQEKFLQHMEERSYSLIIEEQILQKFQKRYKALYQKYQIKSAFYQIIVIKQQGTHETDKFIYFLKGVAGVTQTYPFLNFLAVATERISNSESKMIIYSNFQEDTEFGSEEAIPFLLQFKNMMAKPLKQISIVSVEQKPMQISNFKENLPALTLHELQSIEDYNTVNECFDQQNFIAPDQKKLQLIQHLDVQNQKNIKNQNNLTLNESSKKDKYLKNRFTIIPKKSDPNRPLVKSLQVFQQWKRKKNGGFTCVNKKALDLQKTVIPTLASNVRKMIMSGKNPLNSSLPVQIFKKQSHLTVIAKNFAYAPILLQPYNKSGPIQRLNAIIPFMITVSLLGVSVAKPFNPILGQTYQGWIDGCPIYFQQISHHPPVGYYNFYGRGYKMYGGVRPDVKFGLNNITAFSTFPQYIQFENGDLINMDFGHMYLSGFLFGDRQFNFIDKMFAFDKKNHLFAQFRFGPKSKSLFGKSSDPQDYCESSIYQVSEQFVAYWDVNQPTYPQKKDIIQEISKGHGIWSQYFNIDGKQVLNINKQFPCQMIDQQFPLLSNSWYRQDLISLMKDDMVESQKIKDQMEQSQRRDRKLRQKMNKN